MAALLVFFLAAYLAVSPRTYRNGLLRLPPPSARERLGEALDVSLSWPLRPAKALRVLRQRRDFE